MNNKVKLLVIGFLVTVTLISLAYSVYAIIDLATNTFTDMPIVIL